MNEKFPFLGEYVSLNVTPNDWSSPDLLGTEIELPSGVVCVESKPGKHHDVNEDKYVVMELGKKKVFAVIDAMGEYSDGDFAGGALKEAIEFGARRGVMDFYTIRQRATETIRLKLGKVQSGAVFVSVSVEDDKFSVDMAGDCRFLLIRDKKLKKATKDEGTLNHIRNAVSGITSGEDSCPFPNVLLDSGDVIVLLSDGVLDNILEDAPYHKVVREYQALVKKGETEKAKLLLEAREEKINQAVTKLIIECSTPKEMVERVTQVATKLMYEEDGKVDDLTVLIYKHN